MPAGKPRKKSRRLKTFKNNLIYAALRFLIAAVRLLPFRAGVRLGGRLGRWAYGFLPYERRMIRDHLRIAFGPFLTERECDRLGRDCLDNLGRGMVELIHAPTVRRRMDDYVTCEGSEHLDEALALGKGVIVVTAHTGNWEVMAMWAAAHGYPTNAIAREVYDPRINRLLCDTRRAGGVNPILRGEVSGARQMIRALRNNEILALVIDQDTKVPGEFVDFFGRQAHTPVGVAQLARKFGSPVIPGFSSRKPDGTLHVTIGPPIPPAEVEDKAEQIRITTQRYSTAIEEHIRRHPAQWVWMHRRWKTRPGGIKAKRRKPKANPWLAYWLYRPVFGLLTLGFSALSRRRADWIGDRFGDLVRWLTPARRRIARQNLAVAFGDTLDEAEVKRITRATYRNMAKNTVLYLRTRAMTPAFFEREVEAVGTELIRDAIDRGKGLMLVGGHIGGWELGLYKCASMGVPVHLIAKRQGSEQADQLLVEARRRMGVHTIYHRDSIWEVMRTLSRGEPVAAVMDQNMKRSQGIFVNFFGKPASTVSSTAALVMRTGAAILLGYTVRLPDGRHRLIIEDSIRFQSTGDRDADIIANTQRINDAIEAVVRRYPDQWFWIHRRWKTQPK